MNELKEYINNVKLKIDSCLERYIEDYSNPSSIIVDSMKYSIFAGGKRIRPVLSFLVSDLIGLDYNNIIPFACAIEMVHTYSLIHDDLPALDNDDLRRGMPTNHKKYGENIAILAGDALLNHAFEVLSYMDSKVDYHIFVKVLREFSQSCGYNGMIGGQVCDILYENKDASEEILKYIHSNKTGKILKACFRIPAIVKGVDSITLEKIDKLGDMTGMLFQITDDMLDVTGSAEKLGKTPGKDAESNKNTYIKIYGMEKTQKLAEDLYNNINDLLKELNANTILFDLIDFIYKRDH